MKEVIYILGVLTGFSIVIGILFEIQEWPGADMILTFSAILCIVFIPLFAVYQYKNDKR